MLLFGNQSTGLTAIYPLINQERWNLSIKGGVMSEIAVLKDIAYFGGGDGYFYAVNVNNGNVLWKVDLRTPFFAKPTFENHRVFIHTALGMVIAFDAQTGKRLWHYKRLLPGTPKLIGAGTPLISQDELIVGTSDGSVIALHTNDGHLLWEKSLHNKTSSRFHDVQARAVLDNGILYIPAYDGALYAHRRSTRDILWRFDAGGAKSILIEKERLFFPSSDGTIYALKKDNAQVLWKFQLDGGVPTPLESANDYLLFGSSYQFLYVLNKHTGEGLYRFHVGHNSGFTGSFALDSGNSKLYALSRSGNLYAFKIQKNVPTSFFDF